MLPQMPLIVTMLIPKDFKDVSNINYTNSKDTHYNTSPSVLKDENRLHTMAARCIIFTY